MNRLIRSFSLAVAIAVPSLSFASVEVQQIDEGKVSIVYNTEDASTEVGRAELELQVRRVAEKICGSQQLRIAGSLTQVQENRACYETAVSSAMEKIKKSATG